MSGSSDQLHPAIRDQFGLRGTLSAAQKGSWKVSERVGSLTTAQPVLACHRRPHEADTYQHRAHE
jgi:hypothetical protein